MLMTPGAIAAELDRINYNFEAFARDMTAATRAHHAAAALPPTGATPADFVAYVKAVAAEPSTASTDPIVQFIATTWTPLYATWAHFYSQERGGSWWHNAAYDGEKYLAELIDVRRTAARLGIPLMSPDPTPEHAGGGILGDLGSALKIAAYGALAIGGVYVIGQLIEGARK